MLLPFGKHKYSKLSEVPVDYIKWGALKLIDPKWKKIFNDELSRRKGIPIIEECDNSDLTQMPQIKLKARSKIKKLRLVDHIVRGSLRRDKQIITSIL